MSVYLGPVYIRCDNCGGATKTDAATPRGARRAAAKMGWDAAGWGGRFSGRLRDRDLCSTCREPDPNQPPLPNHT